MTYVIGLTGGIGSGKSTAAQFFSALGAPIIDADQIAHALTKPNNPAFAEIIAHFEQNLLLPNGELNRRLLREIIFEDLAEKAWLEALLHPLIYQEIQAQLSTITYPYCIVMIPLLAEHYEQYKSMLDYVITIQTSPEQQLDWGAQREQCDKTHIQKIISTQASSQERNKIANAVLDNTGGLTVLQKKVEKLHQTFLQHQQFS